MPIVLAIITKAGVFMSKYRNILDVRILLAEEIAAEGIMRRYILICRNMAGICTKGQMERVTQLF